jgi:uncharacterized damage-inducible protein DinB
MIPSLAKEFNDLQLQLDELLQKVNPLCHEQQNFKPGGNSWSILQVFRHLMQSEGQINNYLRKKFLGADALNNAGVKAFFRSIILDIAMRLPLKFKVPDVIQVELEEQYSFETLASEWKMSRDQLADFLQGVNEVNAKKEIFRHPIVGRMSIVQGLQFIKVHVSRHKRQVERIMKEPAFPAN